MTATRRQFLGERGAGVELIIVDEFSTLVALRSDGAGRHWTVLCFVLLCLHCCTGMLLDPIQPGPPKFSLRFRPLFPWGGRKRHISVRAGSPSGGRLQVLLGCYSFLKANSLPLLGGRVSPPACVPACLPACLCLSCSLLP